MLPPAWLTSTPIAHRGLHDAAAGAPENSLVAFGRAAEARYPIELDVQISRDGAAIAFHDDTLDRMIRRRREGIPVIGGRTRKTFFMWQRSRRSIAGTGS